MKDPLGVRPSKGNQGTIRGKEKILLTLVGIICTHMYIHMYSCRHSLPRCFLFGFTNERPSVGPS